MNFLQFLNFRLNSPRISSFFLSIYIILLKKILNSFNSYCPYCFKKLKRKRHRNIQKANTSFWECIYTQRHTYTRTGVHINIYTPMQIMTIIKTLIHYTVITVGTAPRIYMYTPVACTPLLQITNLSTASHDVCARYDPLPVSFAHAHWLMCPAGHPKTFLNREIKRIFTVSIIKARHLQAASHLYDGLYRNFLEAFRFGNLAPKCPSPLLLVAPSASGERLGVDAKFSPGRITLVVYLRRLNGAVPTLLQQRPSHCCSHWLLQHHSKLSAISGGNLSSLFGHPLQRRASCTCK